MKIPIEDTYYSIVTLRNLAVLWRESDDAGLPTVVAGKLGVTVSEVEKKLREMLGKEGGGEQDSRA
jgi:hypothetical protein